MFKLDLLEEQSLVRVRHDPASTTEDHYRGTEAAIQALGQSGFRRLLLDVRDAAPVNFADRPALGEFAANALPGDLRLAVLVSPADVERQREERSARNLLVGMGLPTVRTFTDEAAALDWLCTLSND